MPTLEELRKQTQQLREAKARTDEYNRLMAERRSLIAANKRAGFVARHQTTGRVAGTLMSFGTMENRNKVAGAVDKLRKFGAKRQGLAFRGFDKY